MGFLILILILVATRNLAELVATFFGLSDFWGVLQPSDFVDHLRFDVWYLCNDQVGQSSYHRDVAYHDFGRFIN
jgi:hypothetical protein